MSHGYHLHVDSKINKTETASQTQKTDLDGTGMPVLPKLSLDETDWRGAGWAAAVGHIICKDTYQRKNRYIYEIRP